MPTIPSRECKYVRARPSPAKLSGQWRGHPLTVALRLSGQVTLEVCPSSLPPELLKAPSLQDDRPGFPHPPLRGVWALLLSVSCTRMVPRSGKGDSPPSPPIWPG